MSNLQKDPALLAELSPRDQALYHILETFLVADQDLVGLGAMVGFLVAGGLTQIFSLVLHRLKDCKSHSLKPNGAVTKTHITFRIASALAPSATDEPVQFWINIISALLIGLSDQQLLMGLFLLAIVTGTKGPSFSLWIAQYISFFTLITHAATVVSMRPYFRKYRFLTLIRVVVMLGAYILWIYVNAAIIQIMNLIEDAAFTRPPYMPDPHAMDAFRDEQHGLNAVFGIECAVMSWVYLSMVPSLFISDELVKVRKAVAIWPLRKGPLDDNIISDWLQRRESNTNSSPKTAFGDILLWPSTLFCRLYLRTKSKRARVILWLVAELFFAWALVPIALLILFLALLFFISIQEAAYSNQTEWSFGQILPIAMVILPFWALCQGYAEDKRVAIEERKASQGQAEYLFNNEKISGDIKHSFTNDISVEPVDGDSIEAAIRPRSQIFTEDTDSVIR